MFRPSIDTMDIVASRKLNSLISIKAGAAGGSSIDGDSPALTRLSRFAGLV